MGEADQRYAGEDPAIVPLLIKLDDLEEHLSDEYDVYTRRNDRRYVRFTRWIGLLTILVTLGLGAGGFVYARQTQRNTALLERIQQSRAESLTRVCEDEKQLLTLVPVAILRQHDVQPQTVLDPNRDCIRYVETVTVPTRDAPQAEPPH